MKRKRLTGRIAAAAILALVFGAPACNLGTARAGYQFATIEYQRPSIPCPTCSDDPWPYSVLYQFTLKTGTFQRVGQNSFIATLEVPENVIFTLNVSDRMMFDGQNECSWNEVGENIKVNGQPVHITFRDCAAPWAGQIRLMVHPDKSVSQPD